MSVLSGFSDDELQLLISLPYKVGVYVADADDEEGELDDEVEARALEACLRAVAQKYDGPGVVDDFVRGALGGRAQWPVWAEKSYNIIPDCERAIVLLRQKVDSEDVKNYRAALLEIASTVAQAYGEFVSFDEFPDDEGFFSTVAAKIAGVFSGMGADDVGHPSNVSAAEDSAISRLSAALKIDD